MSKDKEWLKEEIKNNIQLKLDHRYGLMSGEYIGTHMLEAIIDQLDEPEVLSQEWIDEHIDYADVRGGTQAFINVSDLQNLLVPKQETSEQTDIDVGLLKPTIPQFVADYIKEGHELGVDLGTALTIKTDHLNDIKKYIRDNEETFARAWLNGFTVEKEKRYEVILPAVTGAKDVYMVIDEDSSVYFESMDYIVRNACLKSEFTEQEIKDIDPRYMAFAVPVEEEEE